MNVSDLIELAMQDTQLAGLECDFKKVVAHIVKAPAVEMLTIPFVTKSAGVHSDHAIKILYSLSGAPFGLLEARFRFVDSETDELLEIEDVFDAYEDGCIAHPISGQVVENFSDYVYPYYVPSNTLLELRDSIDGR